jgi:hypothetical protein
VGFSTAVISAVTSWPRSCRTKMSPSSLSRTNAYEQTITIKRGIDALTAA